MENNTFKLNSEDRHNIELMYDEPKIGTNTYGAYYLYGVKKNKQDMSFFATANLHEKLSDWGKGSKLTIVRDEYAPNKFGYNLEVVNGKRKGTTSPAPQASSNTSIDNRTHDIHKQVCLKLAVDLLGEVKGVITDAQLIMVDANMNHLLNVLENTSSQKVDAESVVVDSNSEEDFPF